MTCPQPKPLDSIELAGEGRLEFACGYAVHSAILNELPAICRQGRVSYEFFEQSQSGVVMGSEAEVTMRAAAPVGPFQPWRYLYRLPVLAVLCVIGLPLLLLALAPGIRDIPAAGKPLWWRAQRRYARMLVAVLGMRLRVIGELPSPPYLVVSNHISWFDIPLLHALEPMWLVSKASIRDWPVVGGVARAVGTIFIARGNEASRRRAGRRMTALLKRGSIVGVFPGGRHSSRARRGPISRSPDGAGNPRGRAGAAGGHSLLARRRRSR